MDFGARNYDPALGRWMNLDPLAEKYYDLSPYNYVKNSPSVLVDPDGMDVILFIWLTSDGSVGHAGIAVSNYEKDEDGNYTKDFEGNYIEDGTYSFYDLYPDGGVSEKNATEDVGSDFEAGSFAQGETRDWEDLWKFVQSDEQDTKADGVLVTRTDFKTDQSIKSTLESIMDDEYTQYNGAGYNCSDFCAEAYNVISGRLSPNFGKESLEHDDKTYNISTPNKLFRDVRSLKSTYILKNPGKAVNTTLQESLNNRTKKGRKKD